MLLSIHERRLDDLGRYSAPMTIRVWGEHAARRVPTSDRDPEVEATAHLIGATGPAVDRIEIPEGLAVERVSDQLIRVNGVDLHASWTSAMLVAALKS